MDVPQVSKRTITPCSRAIGQETGADNDPASYVALDDAFLTIFVGIDPAQYERKHHPIVNNPPMPSAVPGTHTGNSDEQLFRPERFRKVLCAAGEHGYRSCYVGSTEAITDDIVPLHHLGDCIGIPGISCDNVQAFVANWHVLWHACKHSNLMAICQRRLSQSQTDATSCANNCDADWKPPEVDRAAGAGSLLVADLVPLVTLLLL